MALEAELRARVEQSVKDLDQVVRSLQEVKRLADVNQASTEQLAKLTVAMDSAGGQIHALLETIGHAGQTLIAGADTLKAADPAPAIAEIKVVVGEARAESVAIRQSIAASDRRLESFAKLLETTPGAVSEIRTATGNLADKLGEIANDSSAGNARIVQELGIRLDELSKNLETTSDTVSEIRTATGHLADKLGEIARDSSDGNAQIMQEVDIRLDELSKKIDAASQRLGPLTVAAWLAVAFAAVGAIAAVLLKWG
jgi:uncharacterized protein YoxC